MNFFNFFLDLSALAFERLICKWYPIPSFHITLVEGCLTPPDLKLDIHNLPVPIHLEGFLADLFHFHSIKFEAVDYRKCTFAERFYLEVLAMYGILENPVNQLCGSTFLFDYEGFDIHGFLAYSPGWIQIFLSFLLRSGGTVHEFGVPQRSGGAPSHRILQFIHLGRSSITAPSSTNPVTPIPIPAFSNNLFESCSQVSNRTYLTVNHGKRFPWVANAAPCRLKAVHIINAPTIFSAVFNIGYPFLHKKIRER
ncbi:hypothetical protein AVEN_192152-1, partial [Araneus ventricosus]